MVVVVVFVFCCCFCCRGVLIPEPSRGLKDLRKQANVAIHLLRTSSIKLAKAARGCPGNSPLVEVMEWQKSVSALIGDCLRAAQTSTPDGAELDLMLNDSQLQAQTESLEELTRKVSQETGDQQEHEAGGFKTTLMPTSTMAEDPSRSQMTNLP